ncbi:hypothetical protein Vretifemale_4905 [Volvox reticuliferus]|nr:hypothetical protein Vretifemale_4905 [Volvox reticuliferus]
MSLARGRRVVIIGSGKTAMDCASGLLVSRCAASVTLLYRSAHWPVPRSVLGIPVRRLLFSRAVASMLPPYYTASCVDRAVHAIVRPLKRLFWRGLECAINKKLHMGNGKLEAPPVGLPGDLFYGGQILDDSGAEMMHCEQLTAIKGEINKFVRNGVILLDGTFRPADVILYCTGYKKSYDYLEADLRLKLEVQKDGLYLYRNCLPPHVRHLAFVGSEVNTYASILTYSLTEFTVRP